MKVMDMVRLRKGDYETTGAIMKHENKGFYLNPMFGPNLYVDTADEVELIAIWEYPKGYICTKCGRILEEHEFKCTCDSSI